MEKKILFKFNDVTQYVLRLEYVLGFKKNLDIGGNPTILINDFDDGLRGKQNPVWRLELVYADDGVRDYDFECLTNAINQIEE